MKRRAAPSAFALLLTLLLVVMVGIALAGLARWSMLGAVEVRDATEEVQRRWAMTSCQATLLPRVAILLEQVEQARKRAHQTMAPPAELRVTCHLADLDYELVLTDEQAKLNVNRLLEQTNAVDAQAAVRQLLSPSLQAAGAGKARVQLRPLVMGGGSMLDGAVLPKVGAYGQFLECVTPRDLLGSAQRPGLAATVTCWGDGRINIRRAPAAVMQQVCAGTLSRDETMALIKLRDDDLSQKLSALLDKDKAIDDKQKAKLQTVLTDESRCFGLWIVAQNTQRSYYALTVGEGGTNAQSAGVADGIQRENQISLRHDFNW